ncbi:hypothetical protein ZIOFF_014983 [Zingiber officinale]|uniref:Uncharacterized protein n=1 Tax=Zingiber officinale TaxID=94328 RepID=A0A8J5LVY8_ZINOF|nr:hypothetical protein ZIOFF_014983 [Zingiber officinale]
MAYCKICLLNNAMRVVNLVVNFCGLAIIIYSLCLLKAWKQAVAEFDAAASTLPAPWYPSMQSSIEEVMGRIAMVHDDVSGKCVGAGSSFKDDGTSRKESLPKSSYA